MVSLRARSFPAPASRLFSVICFVFPKSGTVRVCVDPTKGKALGSRWPKWEVDRQKKFLEAKPKRAQVALTC